MTEDDILLKAFTDEEANDMIALSKTYSVGALSGCCLVHRARLDLIIKQMAHINDRFNEIHLHLCTLNESNKKLLARIEKLESDSNDLAKGMTCFATENGVIKTMVKDTNWAPSLKPKESFTDREILELFEKVEILENTVRNNVDCIDHLHNRLKDAEDKILNRDVKFLERVQNIEARLSSIETIPLATFSEYI